MRQITITLLIIYLKSVESSINCYYVSGKPEISNLPDKCDTFILIGSSGINEFTGDFEAKENEIAEFSKIKNQAGQDKKLLISITAPNRAFTKMSSSIPNILKFTSESLKTLKKYNLDGIDIDWEFPVWSWDADKNDRFYFRNLLENLSQIYRQESKLVSVAVSGPPTITKIAYDVDALARFADMVQIMNYDFHVFSKNRNPLVGFNAPLRPMKLEFSVLAKMNSEASMSTWFSLGLPKNITYFGVPTYSRAFRLLTKYLYKPYSPAIAALDEFTDYDAVCELASENSPYVKVWNSRTSSPYLYGPDRLWISYENPTSIKQKVNFAKNLGVAGIMVYSVGNDDSEGKCGNGKYPLINPIDF